MLSRLQEDKIRLLLVARVLADPDLFHEADLSLGVLGDSDQRGPADTGPR